MRPDRIEALAFDYFGTIADKHGMSALIEELVPGADGKALAKLWFLTCQRYCFQMGMMERFLPWSELSAAALDFAAADLRATISAEARTRLLAADAEVPVYPEAPEALARLAARFRLYVLSMGDVSMLEGSQRRAGIDRHFSGMISLQPDEVYKPGHAAYQVGVREIGLSAERIGFVSGNSYDVIGATNFGFPTIWVRRYGQPLDGLGLEPDLVVGDLGEMANALGAQEQPALRT